MNKASLLFAVCVFILIFSHGAFAQHCDILPESIIKLKSPAAGGNFNVWDSIHGAVDTQERFKDAVMLDNGNVLAVGKRFNAEKPDEVSLLFAELGRNGRVLWENLYELPKNTDVVKLFKDGKRVIVLANVVPAKGQAYAWLGFFDQQAGKLFQKTFKGGRAAFTGYDIERAGDGRSLIFSVFSKDSKSMEPGSTVLYRLNNKGGVIEKQSFVIGAENAVHDLHVLSSAEVMAAGAIDDARGRKTGWVMKLDQNLQMIWQKPYPRGAGAEIFKGVPLLSADDNELMAYIGTALPAGQGARAAWVMVIDQDNGETLWQHYFTDDLHLDGRDIEVNEDHVLSILMDANIVEDGVGPDYARLLTMNSRGVIFTNDVFFNGENVDAHRLLIHPHGERLVVGETALIHQVAVENEQAQEGESPLQDMAKRSLEGWVLAAKKPARYEDPCIIQERSLR